VEEKADPWVKGSTMRLLRLSDVRKAALAKHGATYLNVIRADYWASYKAPRLLKVRCC